MSRLLRNPSVLFLVCLPIVLAGCQLHPLAASVAGQQVMTADHGAVNAETATRVKTAMQLPKDELLVAKVSNEPECLSGQLADGLMLVYLTFTGHQNSTGPAAPGK